MDWIRIDNRLVHGQIIETWLPHTNAGAIIVANGPVSADAIQQQIMCLAIPQSVRVYFTTPEEAARIFASVEHSAIVLFEDCTDAMTAWEHGLHCETLNIGNIHYETGRRQLSPSVALSPGDEKLLRQFERSGVRLDFRCVPNDPVQVKF
ncbi:MAG: PTS sugar transporter subunit IIB [Desulfovibrionaceae bacterium]